MILSLPRAIRVTPAAVISSFVRRRIGCLKNPPSRSLPASLPRHARQVVLFNIVPSHCGMGSASASSPNEKGQSKMSRMLSRQPPIFDSGSDRSPVGGAFSVVLCYVACSKVRCLRAKRPTSRPRPGVRGPPSHDLCVTTRSPRSGQQTFSRRWYCAGKSEAVLPSFRHSGRSVGRSVDR